MVNRRVLLLSVPLALPFRTSARDYQGRRAIGVLTPYTYPQTESTEKVFLAAMQDLGYTRGQDFVVFPRYADGENDRLPALASELVQLKVDVIVASTTNATAAARDATSRIPVVFESVADPVRAGFAKSLSHPGYNMTGLSNLTGELTVKRLQLIREMIPGLTRICLLQNPANPYNNALAEGMVAVAQRIGVHLIPVNARTRDELQPAFQTLAKYGCEAVLVSADTYFRSWEKQIADLALTSRLPSIFAWTRSVEVGGLMSYGVDGLHTWRQLATSYVDKIFKGAKPGDLPIELPKKFELTINRTTAGALGLPIPEALLQKATQVIT